MGSQSESAAGRAGKTWRIVRSILVAILGLAVLLRIASLDVFPVLTADSGHYLSEVASGRYARDPAAILSPGHYKTAGYPLLLSLLERVARAIDMDLPTLAVLTHRSLLGLACLWLVLEAGLLSLPVVALLASSAFLAQSNFVLTEGVTVPAAAFCGLAVSRLRGLSTGGGRGVRAVTWLLVAVLVASYLFLLLTKIPMAAFALAILPLGIEIARTGPRPLRPAPLVVPVLALVVATAIYLAALSVGNARSFGAFSPLAGGERIRYWGTWQQVFVVHPENRVRADLAGFFDKGDPYRFLRDVENRCGGLDRFACTGPIEGRRADELLAASGLSPARERLASFGLALLGGGKPEIGHLRNRVFGMNGDERAIQAWQGQMVRRFGDVFGDRPLPRVVPGLGRRPEGPERIRVPQALVTVLLTGVLALLVARRRVSPWSPAVMAAVAHALVTAALAWRFCDVWRYVAPAWTFFAAAATADIARAVQSSSRTRSS